MPLSLQKRSTISSVIVLNIESVFGKDLGRSLAVVFLEDILFYRMKRILLTLHVKISASFSGTGLFPTWFFRELLDDVIYLG